MRITHKIIAIALSLGLLASVAGVLTSHSNSTADAAGSITFAQIGADIDGKANNDLSGSDVAMSSDGMRVAISADGNSGGYVHIYDWDGSAWTQVGADIPAASPSEGFGASIAMSADGSRVVVGAPGASEGAVRVYDWDSGNNQWDQTGSDIVGEDVNDQFGTAVAISDNGARIAIGAVDNTNVNGVQSGHVRVYDWDTATNQWNKKGNDINGKNAGDRSGNDIALSADGTRIAVAAAQSDPNNVSNAGQVSIYELNGATWTQIGGDINGENAEEDSGRSIAMSADGSRLAVGAPGHTTTAEQVRIYDWNGSAWEKMGEDIENGVAGDDFGSKVALSADGSRLLVGAQASQSYTGQVLAYDVIGGTWTQIGTNITGDNSFDIFGGSIAISDSGSRIAIGASEYGTGPGRVQVFSAPINPSAPTITSVTGDNGSLTVVFTAGSDGGSAISNYKYSTDGVNYTALSPAVTASPITIADLTNGTTYPVTIKAVTSFGESPASNSVNGTPASPTTTVKKKTPQLPATGSHSSTTLLFAALLFASGLIVLNRRRFVR